MVPVGRVALVVAVVVRVKLLAPEVMSEEPLARVKVPVVVVTVRPLYVPAVTLPALLMVNLETPEAEAVKIS